MKKLLIVYVLTAALISCSGNGSENSTSDSAGQSGIGGDTTTQHPDGTINSNVISTDTAAMNTGKMDEKKDSADRTDSGSRK